MSKFKKGDLVKTKSFYNADLSNFNNQIGIIQEDVLSYYNHPHYDVKFIKKLKVLSRISYFWHIPGKALINLSTVYKLKKLLNKT